MAVACVNWLSSILLAISFSMNFRTWSYLNRHRPSLSALKQLLRMCSEVPVLEHRGHKGQAENICVTFSYFRTKDLDFPDLKLKPVHAMILFRP